MPRRGDPAPRLLTAVGVAPTGTPAVVVVHPGAVPTHTYERLAAQLRPSAALWVLNLERLPAYFQAALHPEAPATSVEEIADVLAGHLDVLRPWRTPWCLAGWSFGGVPAFALAGRLAPECRPTGLLLLDSIAPVPEYTRLDGELADREVLRWFAMYLGARRGATLHLPATLPDDRVAGLGEVLTAATRAGALPPDTTLPGIRKVLDTYLQGLLRNNRLASAYHPEPVSLPVWLMRPDRGLLDTPDPLGWSGLAADLRVRRCAGDHYTMLHHPEAVPHVAAAAQTLLHGARPVPAGLVSARLASTSS